MEKVVTNNIKPINILFLIENFRYKTKMSRVRFHAVRALEEFANVKYWGPGWPNYSSEKTLADNLLAEQISIDLIICYKAESIKGISEINVLKCITYNEMYDFKATISEINTIKPNFVICHHKNDLEYYKKHAFKKLNCYVSFFYLPHFADDSIYYDRSNERPFDLMLCGVLDKQFGVLKRIEMLLKLPFYIYNFLKSRQNQTPNGISLNRKKIKDAIAIFLYGNRRVYPLRTKYRKVMEILSEKYNCVVYKHPGYIKEDAYLDLYPIEFAKAINEAKICITCTSRYKYRLGKLIEIPMAGAVLASDLPQLDNEEFKGKIIEIDPNWNVKSIVNKLTFYLENDNLLGSLKIKGLEFSAQFNQRNYAINLIEIYKNQLTFKPKIYLPKEGFIHLGQSWICDKLREEFLQFSKFKFVNCIEDAEIVWLISPWAFEKSDLQFLESKFVITTIHHIDIKKIRRFNLYFTQIEKVTNRFHSICSETTLILKTLTNHKIVEISFWINESVFYSITNKTALKIKYRLPENAFLVGSFQKDSEGKSKLEPKLSKGPDILFNILLDMQQRNLNLHVILTGFRRDFIMSRLDSAGISYSYFEMVTLEQLNELYNCLDLYIVSSRLEGGPRAILECAIAKVPIISTNVGIANLILSKDSLFQWEDYLTYSAAKPEVLYAYSKAFQYSIKNHVGVFENALFK